MSASQRLPGISGGTLGGLRQVCLEAIRRAAAAAAVLLGLAAAASCADAGLTCVEARARAQHASAALLDEIAAEQSLDGVDVPSAVDDALARLAEDDPRAHADALAAVSAARQAALDLDDLDEGTAAEGLRHLAGLRDAATAALGDSLNPEARTAAEAGSADLRRLAGLVDASTEADTAEAEACT